MSQLTPITFKNLTLSDVVQNLNYFKTTTLAMSNYSAAFRFMWCRPLGMQFAIINNCLVFKCTFGDKTFFNYPMAMTEEDEDGALDAIESYCAANYIKLGFSAVPAHKMSKMISRYGANMLVSNSRKWRDYLYNASDFISYSGKKFAGQRNHVNKFRRQYSYEYSVLTAADQKEIFAFLKRFESRQLAKESEMAEEELSGVYQVLPYVDMLGLKVGAIKIDGKICAISMGEKCGDQLIIHVEKALTEYDGIYPLMAQEFAKRNAIGGVLYINREDDSGDRGLRKSKLNYNPISIVDKYDIIPNRPIDTMADLPEILGERVLLKRIDDADKDAFLRLEYDEERNRYWGYNWREHIKGEATPDYFIQGIRRDFENKWEVPLGIYLKNGAIDKIMCSAKERSDENREDYANQSKFIGEVVLHNFNYKAECEIGVRLLPEYEGAGYANEALKLLINYALMELNIEKICAKCFKQNARSKKSLEGAGMRFTHEDETYYWFSITAK